MIDWLIPADPIFSERGSDGMIPCAAWRYWRCSQRVIVHVNGEENPFPPIRDAAYRKHAGGGPSHRHRQHAQEFGEDRAWVPEISCWTDRQTHSSQYFATALAGEVTRCRDRMPSHTISSWSVAVGVTRSVDQLILKSKLIGLLT